MFEKAKEVCRAYADAKAVVNKLKDEVAYYKECMRNATTPYEKYIFEREIRNLTAETSHAAETVALYEIAVRKISGRPRTVLGQIYEKGMKWRDVVDENGIHISDGSIGDDLKKAFAVMESEIETIEAGFADSSPEKGG